MIPLYQIPEALLISTENGVFDMYLHDHQIREGLSENSNCSLDCDPSVCVVILKRESNKTGVTTDETTQSNIGGVSLSCYNAEDMAKQHSED